MQTPGIILPNGSGSAADLILPDSVRGEAVWECPFCEATYRKGESEGIARHIDSHDDEINEALEQRNAEPLREHDEEALRWMRQRAQAAGDKTVKGVR